MDDLGLMASASSQNLMLGGGNPARIPEVEQIFRQQLTRIAASSNKFARMAGMYGPPGGDVDFRRGISQLLHDLYGWEVDEGNVALTAGSQNGFYMLFNLLAGLMTDGTRKTILLPMAPEYIGYSDLGPEQDFFLANRPTVQVMGEHRFKYFIDFDCLEIDESIGAICLSRPTNPTGNVITDAELTKLAEIASGQGVPLIIDSAYGAPFPNIVFGDAAPIWDDNTIYCLSLSKLGLPAVRTGIVVARREIVEAISAMNAIMHLSVSCVGPVIAGELLKSGELVRISNEIIAPFYKSRVDWTISCIDELFGAIEYFVHIPEGAFFLWLWLPDLPITSDELYRRLKSRGVFVISGHHFFPGLRDDWQHRNECIRLSYAQDQKQVAGGLRIIADEVRRVS